MSNGSIVISALKILNDDGRRKRPMFVGSLDAKTLDSICDVPSFSSSTNNHQIAGNILKTPVKDWQRPEKSEKITSIKNRFDQDGEFMPNPVLLAVHRDNEVEVNRATNDNGDPTGTWELTIKNPNVKDVFWILDGQHRVRGLAKTKRNTNRIPLVILHDHSDATTYQHADFARVFSEVSTQVSPLNKLHKEWLEYVYDLGKYNDPRFGLQHKRAMETVAHLCEQHQFGSTKPVKNLFYNKVQFNPEDSHSYPVFHYGFQYSALEYTEWIFKYYFKSVPDSVYITPLELAEQINNAMVELTSVVKNTPRDDCVLWGKPSKRRSAVDRAMFVAFLVRLTREKSPNWRDIFSKLGFGAANWDFSIWIKSTEGKAGTNSKKVAENILTKALIEETFPSLPQGIEDYFNGDSAEFLLTAMDPSLSGQAQKKSAESKSCVAGRLTNFDTMKTGRAFVKIKKQTSNIAAFAIHLESSPHDRAFHAKSFEKGIELSQGTHLFSLETEFFGEVTIINKIKITVH